MIKRGGTKLEYCATEDMSADALLYRIKKGSGTV